MRRAVNEAGIKQFFSAWDPAWRWVLLLGIRNLRADAGSLGALAAAKSPEGAGWDQDAYVYGPLIHGLTAAAVNEAAQHCEDLFAVLKFLRDRLEFVKRITSYKPGRVTQFGSGLAQADGETIRRLFIVPSSEVVKAGLAEAEAPDTVVAAVEEAVERLIVQVRNIAQWYVIYESFHIDYKHGLQLAMRPFGNPTDEAIAQRQQSVESTLVAFTSEPISAMLKRPAQQHGMTFPNLIEEARPYLNELVSERALLRYQMSGPPVDMDEIVALSANVTQLLQVAAANRLAVGDGLDEHGHYRFRLPGIEPFELVDVVLALPEPPSLADFGT